MTGYVTLFLESLAEAEILTFFVSSFMGMCQSKPLGIICVSIKPGHVHRITFIEHIPPAHLLPYSPAALIRSYDLTHSAGSRRERSPYPTGKAGRLLH